jgi:hypothetical protein
MLLPEHGGNSGFGVVVDPFDASSGSVEELQRIVAQIRAAWPQVHIVVRGDSGFCREELMSWCEAEGVDYLLGLAKTTV